MNLYPYKYMYIRPEYHEDGIYHVYNRGVAKLPIFLKKTDYANFRDIMRYYLVGFPKREVSDTSQQIPKRRLADDLPVCWKADPNGNGMFRRILDLLAYCLMPNHIHFLIRIREVSDTSQSPISEFMKRLSITYAHKFNHDNQRVGPIFQGRFKIKQLHTDELVAHVASYIHLNPAMAGLVESSQLWPWSDINDYYNFAATATNKLSKPLFVLEYFNRRPSQYRDFVENQFSERDAKIISPVAIDAED